MRFYMKMGSVKSSYSNR